MVSPEIALIVATILIAFCAFLFWPGKGLYTKLRLLKVSNQKIQIEDALKHLYECEFNNHDCTLLSLAGKLNISKDAASELIVKLEGLELIQRNNQIIEFSAEGRAYALRIIRVHRLWERYLADETSVGELDWHEHAETVEHTMSPDEANELAARLGNPLIDPHGDPIPQESGSIKYPEGIDLSKLDEGQHGEIIHIEDEPHSIYAQLIAEGLYKGMHLKVIEKNSERIRFEANGEERILAPIFAENLTIKIIERVAVDPSDYKRLSSLKKGEETTVFGIARSLRGQQRRRLMDLGVVPGTKVTAEMVSAFGDPVAYKIRGATIALRRKQADQIYVTDKEVRLAHE